MTAQPEALRLADEVDEVAQTYPDMAEVSAELRRLHQNHIQAWEVIHQQGVELIALRKQRDELLEALKLVLPTLEQLKFQYADCAYGNNFVQSRADTSRKNYDVARATIAKAEVK